MVMKSKQFDDGFTPVCNECGIALCWDISDIQYKEEKEFWDKWCCKDCNPQAVGSLKAYRQALETEVNSA